EGASPANSSSSSPPAVAMTTTRLTVMRWSLMLCHETEGCARISGAMRRLTRVTVTLVTVLGLLHFVLAQDRRRPAAVKQPIAFSPKQRAEAGVKCSSCHFKVETDEQAGLPSASDCAQCHQGARSSAALMKLM